MPPRCKNPNKPADDDPGWLSYVEPYFGGGSVLFANDPEGISEVVNDLDRNLANFWRTLQGKFGFDRFMRLCQSTPFSQEEYDSAISYIDDHGEGKCQSGESWTHAHAFFVANRQSRQGLEKDFATLTRNRTRRGMNEQASAWLSAIDGLPEFHARLKRVVILNDDAVKIIKQQDGPRTLFYCDPCYLHNDEDGTPIRSTTGEYKHEMSLDDHVLLLDVLSKISGRFMLSGYRSKLYKRYQDRFGWRTSEIVIDNKASSGKNKELRTEVVWMNF